MTKDLITITLEREKAEYLAACFEDDLEWLGVTAGIDRGPVTIPDEVVPHRHRWCRALRRSRWSSRPRTTGPPMPRYQARPGLLHSDRLRGARLA